MKKLLYLIALAVAIPFALTSCSDDGKDLPDVDFSINIAGGVMDQNSGTIYAVQGDTLKIESLTVTNVETDKPAALTGAEYYWDYNFLGGSPFAPFSFKIYISDETSLGDHVLSIRTGVLAVDKEPAVGIVSYPVVVVADSTQLPQVEPAPVLTSRVGLKAE